jgi:hypothetical protein
VVVNLLGSDVVATVCCLHCRYCCCNDVALDSSLSWLLSLQRALLSTKYFVCVSNNFIMLVTSELLPLVEVLMVVFVRIEFNEPLIGVVYLVSLQPYFFNGSADRALSACGGALVLQG